MLQVIFLFINAAMSIGLSILLLIDLALNINIKELITVLACVSSISNFYTIYQLQLPKTEHHQNQNPNKQHYYIVDVVEDEDNIYTILPSDKQVFLNEDIETLYN